MAQKEDNAYAKRMAKIAAQTPEQVAKMSPKQLTAYHGAVRWIREQADTRAKEENAKLEVRNQAAAAKASKIAAIRSDFTMPKVTKGQVAAFLWMPQVNRTLRGLAFPVALLVSTFAQILSSVGLIASDHPALSYTGAKSYRLTQILEEARINLPPASNLWGAGSILATRQYAIFVSSIGVLITGGLSILTMFTSIFFGAAKAFAQSPYNKAGDFSVAGDLGIGFINAIFDPNMTSVTSSGLGELFALYSKTMLVFAGIILLWIIVSAVAETARTGIPMGKQFNHIWAPIRLIVALGLLVPLGSGLNSGQHMIIFLTRWGSTQANEMWVSFANKTAISGTSSSSSGSSGSIPGALSAIPVTKDNFTQVSDQLFDILLCQNIYNMLRSSDMPPMNINQEIISSPNKVKVIQSNAANVEKDSSNYLTRQATWKVPSHLNCGDANFTELKPSAGGSGLPGALAQVAMLAKQSTELANFMGDANSLARDVANVAVLAQKNDSDMYYYIDMLPQDFNERYNQIAGNYAELRANSIKAGLQNYNSLLGLNFQDEARQRGWISAPIWLNRIAEQNGRVLEAASVLPKIVSPGMILTASEIGQQEPVRGDFQNAWSMAQEFMGRARLASQANVKADPLNRASALMRASFEQILQPTNNPLGAISSYGRSLMAQGVRITFASSIQPEAKCVRNPQTGSCYVDQYGREIEGKSSPLTYGEASRLLDVMGNLGGGNKALHSIDNSATFTPGKNPEMVGADLQSKISEGIDGMPASVLRPAGSMFISFGFMAGYVLPLLPFFRFMLGVVGWVLLLVEAILAAPLMAISLLKTDGEGFMTQNFQTGVIMILGLILRPMLMIFGLLLGLVVFNGIMNITNVSYLAAVGGIDASDNSALSFIIYMIIYGMLAYTLANSAFKAIDIVPNQVMSWLGARLDQRVDDASVIHQQSAAMVGNLGMISAMGGGIKFGGKSNTQAPPPATEK